MCADYISTIKDIVTISVSITAGLISVLTYLNVRKTFFQPLRTEMTKIQLDLTNKIYKHLIVADLNDTLDYLNILRNNLLVRMYGEGYKLINDETHSNIISKTKKFLILNGNEHELFQITAFESDSKISARLFMLTDQHIKFTGILANYQSNVFIPDELKTIINTLQLEVNENLKTLDLEITNFIETFKIKASQNNKIDFDIQGIYNSFMVKHKSHKKSVSTFSELVQNIFQVNKILKN